MNNSESSQKLNWPTDPQIEREVLAACYRSETESSGIFANVRSMLSVEDFSTEDNRRIFRALCRLADAGRALTMVEVFNCAREYGQPVEIGYIVETDSFPFVVDQYVQRLRTLTIRRRLMLTANQLVHSASDMTLSVEDLLSRATSSISGIAGDTSLHEDHDGVLDIISDAGGINAFLKAAPSVASPWPALDAITGGWQKGELIILGARPSMGKTACALNAAMHAAGTGTPTVFYSFEMSRESIVRRLICLRASLSYQELMSGQLDASTRRVVCEAKDFLSALPLSVVAAAGRSALAIQVHAERLARKGKCGFIAADYLGLFKSTGSTDNRVHRLGDIAKQCKEVAMSLGVPFMLLAQLNRLVVARDDKRPTLADLRDSGELEEHADLVAFLHRPGYYDRNNQSIQHDAELIIAKQRNGDTPIIPLEFYWRGGVFLDPSQQQRPETREKRLWVSD